MSFKKFNTAILDALATNNITKPTAFQSIVLPKIKSGVNLFAIGKKGSGKTTSLIICTMQKLGSVAFEDAPRALILVENKNEALRLKEAFLEFTKRTDLRVYAAYDEYTFDTQKEEVYYGQDIIIGTPKRLNKLFLMNALNVSQLKLFVIEDAEFAVKNVFYSDVIRIPQSIEKCQYLVFAEELLPKIARLEEVFMYNAHVIKR